jgi:tartrate dehydratase beta subunit/fumarate hydratase class I family protein
MGPFIWITSWGDFCFPFLLNRLKNMKNKIINIIKKTLFYTGIFFVSVIVIVLIFGPDTSENLNNKEDIKVEQKVVLGVKNKATMLRQEVKLIVKGQGVKTLTKEDKFMKEYVGKKFTIDHKKTFDVDGYKGPVNL